MEQGFKGIEPGMIVRARDGEKIGKVKQCDQDTFLIEKGLFFPKDYLARYDQIGEIREGEAWLLKPLADFGKSQAETKQTAASPTAEGEELRVPLSEEELEASKRVKSAGEVRVRKEVTTEQRELTVPVMKEQVKVERVPAGQAAKPGEASFEDETISVPLREEEVEIRKRPVVREEVRVRKERGVEEQRFAESVRKETAEIEEDDSKRPTEPVPPGGYHAPGK